MLTTSVWVRGSEEWRLRWQLTWLMTWQQRLRDPTYVMCVPPVAHHQPFTWGQVNSARHVI